MFLGFLSSFMWGRVMARHKKPAELKRAEGNRGKRKIEDSVITLPTSIPIAPQKIHAEAKRVFDAMVEEFAAINAISRVDGPAMVLAAEHYAIALLAAQHVKKGGLTVEGYRKSTVKNPMLAIFNTNSKAYMEWASVLGLTLKARANMVGKSEDPAAGVQTTIADHLFSNVKNKMQDEMEAELKARLRAEIMEEIENERD